MLGGVESEVLQHVCQPILRVILKDRANVLVHIIMHGARRSTPIDNVISKSVGQFTLPEIHFPGHANGDMGNRQAHHEEGLGDESVR